MVINQEYFAFKLGTNITLGLPLDDMGTVMQVDTHKICVIPGVADFWHGIVNLKGSLLWILDSDRFFNLNLNSGRIPPKLTVIVIKNRESANQKQVAMVTQQLNGIVEIKSSSDQSLSSEVSPQLRQCCSMVTTMESETIHLIESSALLKQLYQQSTLTAN